MATITKIIRHDADNELCSAWAKVTIAGDGTVDGITEAFDQASRGIGDYDQVMVTSVYPFEHFTLVNIYLEDSTGHRAYTLTLKHQFSPDLSVTDITLTDMISTKPCSISTEFE